MKTKLLFSVLFSLSLTAFSQTLDSEDFNSLTIGNFSEDLTGATAGQGGFFIFGNNGAGTSTNSATSNFQVVAGGDNSSQGASILSPDGDSGLRFLFKFIDWSTRTAGNDIVEFEYTFNTDVLGGGSTSNFRSFIANDAGGVILGWEFNPVDGVLTRLATLNNGGTPGLFNVGTVTLPANTWVRIGCAYNTVTGELRWAENGTDSNGTFLTNGAGVDAIPNQIPAEIDWLALAFTGSGNTLAKEYIIDDYESKATATDQLLGVDDVEVVSANLSLYPNPANNVITLKTDLSVINVTVFNSLGQEVISKNSDFTNINTFNISDLNSGIYIININTEDGRTTTKKFIKQ